MISVNSIQRLFSSGDYRISAAPQYQAYYGLLQAT
jgi:hypothetical protein